MKYALLLALFATTVFSAKSQEDKSKRASPPAVVTQKIASGATVTIDYSQPSVKGRTIGKDLEPIEDTVWRTGANENTIFEVSQDVMVDGKALPKGKYALFTIMHGGNWTVIFSKNSKQWGAYTYKPSEDALRIMVKGAKSSAFAEKFTFMITPAGMVSFVWGDHMVGFMVK